ncbi:MAG: acetylxylan esterase [Nitrospirales bacterium]|nr:acetylxylan esterase [Nitrospirales bacterium]
MGSIQFKRWMIDRLPPQFREWLWARKVEFGNRRIRELGCHLSNRIHQAAQQDLMQFERVVSNGEWEFYRDKCLEALRRSFPDHSENLGTVSSMVAGTMEYAGCRIDNIVFQGHRDLPVTANLYRPIRTTQKIPAIVICHSHHDSKTEEELQCMGMTWAQQGCVVFVMDLLGHGERRQHPFVDPTDYGSSFRVDRQDYYFRSVLGMQLDMVGESLMGWMVQDVRRGIDLLWADPQIDRDRIIVIGSVAGGGDLAAVVGALDERVAALVAFNFGPSSMGDWDSTRNLPDTARSGFWPWIILASLAPRRLVSGREFAWNPAHDPVWARLEKVYELFDKRNFLRSVHGSGRVSGHGPMDTHCTNVGPIHRGQLYPIFQEWFDIPIPSREVIKPLPKEKLACLTMDTRRLFSLYSVHEVTQKICQKQLNRVRRVRASQESHARAVQLQHELVEVLGPMTPFTPYRVRSIRNGFGRSEYVVLEVEKNLFVRLQLLLPSGLHTTKPPVVIGIAQEGNFPLRKERRSLIRSLLGQGIVVCLTELRGIGDGRHGELYRGRISPSAGVAATSLMLGESLGSSRVRDLRTVIDYLGNREDIDRRQIGLWGDSLAATNVTGKELAVPLDATPFPERGEPLGGVATLLAALFEPQVQGVYIHGGLMSFDALLDEPFLYHPADSIIRGLLRIADLPDIAAELAPRPLRMESLVDGGNRQASRKQIEETYHLVGLSYARAEKPDGFSLEIEKSSADTISLWFRQMFNLP